MAHPVIGLLGKKRSGKDTLAGFLTERHGFTRYAFADPLKEAALVADPLIQIHPDESGILRDTPLQARLADYHIVERLSDVVDALGWEDAKTIREVRRTLQQFGMGVRSLDLDFWVRATMTRVGEIDGPVVVTDVRFPNEADAIEQAGGLLIRVVRPGTGHDFGSDHVSETALDDRRTHARILNDGSLDDLGFWADQIARALDLP